MKFQIANRLYWHFSAKARKATTELEHINYTLLANRASKLCFANFGKFQ